MLIRFEYVLCLVLLVEPNWANNYASYINRLIDDGKQLHKNFLDTNPNAQIVLDRLNIPINNRHDLLVDRMPMTSQDMTDHEWHTFLNEWTNSKRRLFGHFNGDDDEDTDQAEQYSDRTLRGSESPLTYLPSDEDLPETELSLRRNEVAYQNQLWGEHKVSGGSGEIGQWLDYALLGAGAQDNESADGLDTVTVQSGLGLHNLDHEQIKMDNLPAYCDPPNPCPLNYDPEVLSTPCDKGIENTIEFNREWIRQKMVNGECSCDSEHMVSCPASSTLGLGDAIFGQGLKLSEKSVLTNPYLRGQKRKRLVAKKRFKRSWRPRYNPYLFGKPHRSAVKKAGNYPALPYHNM